MIAQNQHDAGQSPDDSTALMTIGDLAQQLRVSLRQVRRLKSEHSLPEAILLGKSERWSSAEIGEWIAAKCPDRETWEQQRNDERVLPVETD